MSSGQLHINAPASNFKMLRAMVGIGLICALMIVLTFEGTFSRIEKNKAEALQKAIFKVLPDINTTKAFELTEGGEIKLSDQENKEGQIIYAGYDENNSLKGIALEASGQGYADIIRILYGYDPEKETVVGFYVLESKETPGLGDKIEKDEDFLENFKQLDVSLEANKTIQNDIVTVKQGTKQNPWEIDGITGATISSRAIGKMLAESTKKDLPIIQKQLDKLKNN